MSLLCCSTINVAVFSFKSGQEINNPWGLEEVGPERTATETCRPRLSERGRQRYYGRDPREQDTEGTVDSSSRHGVEAETSP